MKLFTETQGSGPELVLLHGWGLSGNVWEGIFNELAQFARVTLVDLPGYGRSEMLKPVYNLNTLAAAVAKHISDDSIVLGWSLGGMITQQMAMAFPHRVAKLILVASSPQYYRSDYWPHAMSAELLQSFADELVADYKATILQFLSIQALGSEHAQDQIRVLRKRVFRDGIPSAQALQAGLDILLNINLRSSLRAIKQPCMLINGQHDRLVPLKTAVEFANLMNNCQLQIIDDASHAPFISHPKAFINLVKQAVYD